MTYISNRVFTYKLSVNCKVAQDNLLITTPPNFGRFICTSVWFSADNVSSLGITGASVSVGHTATGYADFVSNQALPNSSFASNQFVQVSLRAEGSSRISCPASTGMYIKIVTASDATNYTGTFFITGHYTLAP